MGDKKDYNLVNDEKMEGVSGGGCWFGARFEAPDGHDVGCSRAYYRVQFSDRVLQQIPINMSDRW